MSRDAWGDSVWWLFVGMAAGTLIIWDINTETRVKPVMVTDKEYGENWPFTLPEGELWCDGRNKVLFKAEGVVYAVNGIARTQAHHHGWEDSDLIRRYLGDGGRLGRDALISRGLSMCAK